MSEKQKILVVDNDKAICWVLEKAFTGEGYLVDTVLDGSKALDKIGESAYALVIMDIMMPVMDGLSALKHILELPNPPETIMVTAHSNIENTVEAMKLGAFDYIVKPFDIDEILSLAKRAINKYASSEEKTRLTTPIKPERIIGDSPSMQELYKMLGRVASTDSSVLITGETGTGKDLFAHAIHFHSSRSNGPFITVNCVPFLRNFLKASFSVM